MMARRTAILVTPAPNDAFETKYYTEDLQAYGQSPVPAKTSSLTRGLLSATQSQAILPLV